MQSQSEAQYYFFGRNKVQYEKFNWKVLKTEHFNIYYYDDFGEMAEIGAGFAEEAFEEYKVKFNHYITAKIPLIFYNTHLHFQQTNTVPGFIPEGVGGFFEFIKGRVVIPYLGSIAQFKHVIRHELVHVFMTNKIYNLLTDHRIDSGRFPELWFVEGLAEYWSTDWDTQSEMVMRDAVLNGIFASLENIEQIYGSYLMYKEGQKFLEFVSEKYGAEKVLMIMENFWRFQKFNDVIEFTLGQKIEEIDNQWIYWMRQQYFPLYQNSMPHFIQSKKLTETGYNFNPRYYRGENGGEIYFIGNHNGYTSLFRMKYNPGAKEPEPAEVLIEGERSAEFEAFHLLENEMDLSQKGLVAFVTKSMASDVIHIYSIKEEEIVSTLRFDELISIKSPAFSADGNKIAFSATDKKGFVDLYIYDLNDKNLVRLTNDYYSEKDPVFSADGSRLIFSSDRTDGIFKGKFNLFEIDIASRGINYLTYVNADISTPHFNNDYSKLFFTCDYEGIFNIWQMNFDSNIPVGMTRFTRFITSAYDFTFVNNSTMVTSGFENFSFQFYNLDLDSVPDTAKKFVSFNFDRTGGKWIADRIPLNPEVDRLIYENEYTLDYAVSQVITDPVYGTRGGALFLLSDLLGDDRYLFYIYNNAEVQSEILKNFDVSLTRINMKERSNYGYGIFHYSGRRYDIRESDEYFYERVYGGFLTLFYPLSSFRRIETEVSLANSDKELIGDIITRKSLLLSNSISFVHDNSIWGPSGPLDGSRLRILLGYTTDIKYSNVNYYSFIADYRNYFRISLRSTVAARAAVFINHGKEARRYFAGGSWDLRGWPRFSIRGEKLWLSSVEFRFPLIDRILINFPMFGLGFFNIRGAAFFDAGGAWDIKYKQTLGSVGAGIRINLFNAIVLRYDIGKKIEKNFTSFQPKLFYQFFFGWDF